ncbi:unnamed protein product [Boreogadus saida]
MADPNERNLRKMAMDVMAMIKTSLGSDNSSNGAVQSKYRASAELRSEQGNAFNIIWDTHLAQHVQRHLNLVSPDETGYTGAGLTRAWGGKGCLYIMPIQHRLSTDPLPFTASEFKDMPKARCVTCSQSVPLQLLSMHVDTCSRSETTYPICEQWVASDIVEIHASTCGERVTFIGEPGIDNGALKKEFLTEMVAGVERRFFEGGTTGKTPKYSITDVGSHNFKTIGEIFAVSIVQGGPPLNFFMPWCYDFISTGELDYGAVTEDDVADLDLKKQIQQIRAADDVDVLEIDKIVACGYTGPISIQKKEEIVAN